MSRSDTTVKGLFNADSSLLEAVDSFPSTARHMTYVVIDRYVRPMYAGHGHIAIILPAHVSLAI